LAIVFPSVEMLSTTDMAAGPMQQTTLLDDVILIIALVAAASYGF